MNRYCCIITDLGAADFHDRDFRDFVGNKQLRCCTPSWLPPEYPNITLGFDVFATGASFHKFSPDIGLAAQINGTTPVELILSND